MNSNHLSQLFNTSYEDWTHTTIAFDGKDIQIKKNQEFNKNEATIAIDSIKDFMKDASNVDKLKNAGRNKANCFVKNLTNLKEMMGDNDKAILDQCISLMHKIYPSSPKGEQPS